MKQPGSKLRQSVGFSLLIAGSICVLAWMIGFLFGDRWWFTQWFLWLTGLILVPGGLLIFSGWKLLGRRWSAVALLLPLLGTIEYVSPRWNGGQVTQQSEIRILQWTAGPIGGVTDKYGQFMVGQDPDILIVEGARRAASSDAFRAWSDEHTVLFRGPFLIASRLPVIQSRTVAWADDILVVSLITQLPSGKPLDILIIDLPSDPAISRSVVVRNLRTLLKRVDQEPNMILGDFNLTQTSSVLRQIRSGFTPSWSRTGKGWGGTYPRSWPFYRLDHVLDRGPDSGVSAIKVIDPGFGRHRAQMIQYSE